MSTAIIIYIYILATRTSSWRSYVNTTLFGLFYSAIVHLLNSNPDPATTCIGDSIQFTCTVLSSGALQWAVESINNITVDPIRLFIDDPLGVKNVSFLDIHNVTLVSAVQDSTQMQLGNLTSEMTVAVTSNTLEKHVFCGDGTPNERLSIVIEEKRKLSN